MGFDLETLIFVLIFISTQLYLISTVKNNKYRLIILFLAIISFAFALIGYFNIGTSLNSHLFLFELALVLNLLPIFFVIFLTKRQDYKLLGTINITYLLLFLSIFSSFFYFSRIGLVDYVENLVQNKYSNIIKKIEISEGILIINGKIIDSNLENPTHLKEIYFSDFYNFSNDKKTNNNLIDSSLIEKIFYDLPENKLKKELIKNTQTTFHKYIKNSPIGYCLTDNNEEKCYFNKDVISIISEYTDVSKYENGKKYLIINSNDLDYIERLPLEMLSSIQKFGIKGTNFEHYTKIIRNFKEINFFDKSLNEVYFGTKDYTYFLKEDKDLIYLITLKK